MGIKASGAVAGFLLCAVLALAGCGSSTFEAPELQGPAVMVDDAGKPRLWFLSKNRGTPPRGSAWPPGPASWRTDTLFDFDQVPPSTR